MAHSAQEEHQRSLVCPQLLRAVSPPEETNGKLGDMTASQPRFLQLADVAEVLNVSARQAYALVRSGDLKAIQVGGRNQWRVESSELEAYIERQYAKAEEQIREHTVAGDAPGDRDG